MSHRSGRTTIVVGANATWLRFPNRILTYAARGGGS